MSDACKKFFLEVFPVYLLVILVYSFWLCHFIAIINAFPASWLVSILFLALIIFIHLGYIGMNEKNDIDMFKDWWSCDNNNLWFIILVFSLFCPCVFLYIFGDYVESLIKLCEDINNKWAPFILVVKIASWIGFVVLYGFYQDSGFRTVTYSILAFLLATHLFYSHKIVRACWAFLVVVIPFVILVVLLIPWICWCTICGSLKGRYNQPQVNQAQPNQAQANQQPIELNEIRVPDPVPPRNNVDVPEPEQPQRFGMMNRMPTMRVLSGVFKDWKRSYSIKDQQNVNECSVCCEEFKKGDEIIELHWGKNHIFHPQCIERWAVQNKTCPLCRSNIAELARKEKANPPKPDIEKQESNQQIAEEDEEPSSD